MGARSKCPSCRSRAWSSRTWALSSPSSIRILAAGAGVPPEPEAEDDGAGDEGLSSVPGAVREGAGAGAVDAVAGVEGGVVPVPPEAAAPGTQPAARVTAATARTALCRTALRRTDERFIGAPREMTCVRRDGSRARAVAHVTEKRRACCEEGPSVLLSTRPHARRYSPQRGRVPLSSGS
ncbi:hypothetical protein GCM10017752_25920 [Streptomyces roseoviridis]